MIYVPSLDWVSLACELPLAFSLPEIDSAYVHSGRRFVCKAGEEYNPYYSFSRTFFDAVKGRAFHFFASPRHPAANPRDCSIKVANSLLYDCSRSESWVDVLKCFVSALKLKIDHLQRLDICGDFNEFSGGRRPAVFIRDYFTAPRVSKPSFIRHGSNKFRTFGEKKLGLLDFQTLSFGTRESPVQVNLYNKSLELKSKDKPWIRDLWRSRGLDESRVWRVEFSLNPQGMMLHNVKHNFITEVELDGLEVYSRVSALFTTYASRYFRFKYVTKEDEVARRKVKDLKEVALFDFAQASDFVPISIVRRADGTRREQQAADYIQQVLDDGQVDANSELFLKQSLAFLRQRNISRRELADIESEHFLRGFLMDIYNKDSEMYSVRSRRRRIERLLQVLKHKRFEDSLNGYAWAYEYLQDQIDAFVHSMIPVVQLADNDMLEL